MHDDDLPDWLVAALAEPPPRHEPALTAAERAVTRCVGKALIGRSLLWLALALGALALGAAALGAASLASGSVVAALLTMVPLRACYGADARLLRRGPRVLADSRGLVANGVVFPWSCIRSVTVGANGRRTIEAEDGAALTLHEGWLDEHAYLQWVQRLIQDRVEAGAMAGDRSLSPAREQGGSAADTSLSTAARPTV